jgi:hypothetical protein
MGACVRAGGRQCLPTSHTSVDADSVGALRDGSQCSCAIGRSSNDMIAGASDKQRWPSASAAWSAAS